jgi:hypothetical protein
VIQIDHIVQGVRAFAYLFGETHVQIDEPLAPRRGIPEDASPEVLGKLLADGYYAHSWITWKEISESGWQNQGFSQNWWLLLDMMGRLAEEYGDDSVRLVVAFA